MVPRWAADRHGVRGLRPQYKGVATPLQGGRDSLTRGSRLPYKGVATSVRTINHAPSRQMVSAAAWSPGGTLIATVCEDWGLRLWEADSGALVWCVWGHTGLKGCLW